MYVGSELTCMDFLPTKQMLFRHVVASSLLLGTVHRRHKAWPILSSMSITDEARMVVVADLSSREVVAGSECRRVLVEGWFAIFMFCVIWEMGKTEESWLLWLPLLLKIFGVHVPAAKIQLYGGHETEMGTVWKRSIARENWREGKVVSWGKTRDSDDS